MQVKKKTKSPLNLQHSLISHYYPSNSNFSLLAFCITLNTFFLLLQMTKCDKVEPTEIGSPHKYYRGVLLMAGLTRNDKNQ